jgi:hypothetical protein
MMTWLGSFAVISAGKIVCSTSVALPAVPTAKWYLPALIVPGVKVRLVDPRNVPSTAASPISAAASTAARCWRSNPDRSRPPRILSMRKGIPVTSERLNDVRSICPPPSPRDPSISIIVVPCACTPSRTACTHRYLSFCLALDADYLVQGVNNLHQVRLSRHHVVDRLVRCRRFIDHVCIFPALDAIGHASMILKREAPLRLVP